MGCSGTSAKSPMAQFLKSLAPQELWKASLKPRDPLKPDDPGQAANPFDPSTATQSVQAAKPPGTGLTLDVTA
jgi:hypothetical protein